MKGIRGCVSALGLPCFDVPSVIVDERSFKLDFDIGVYSSHGCCHYYAQTTLKWIPLPSQQRTIIP
ncbi:MAG: hypothetical protein MI892_00985 [Desulfobacterales bacterium]|nr:hypothetical protein [Desulfobacterales bacterium]